MGRVIKDQSINQSIIQEKTFFQAQQESFKLTELIDISKYPICIYLADRLLKDCTTGKNIIWGTDSYTEEYPEFTSKTEMTAESIRQNGKNIIQPRVLKNLAAQKARTKAKAEVFTPSWLCNQMNNYCDEDWFGRPDVFNKPSDKSWTTNEEFIVFDKRKTKDNPNPKKWTDYVKSTRLEMTCGEAPFLVSRYDTTTGQRIEVKDRIGLLDRKLRVIYEQIKAKPSKASLDSFTTKAKEVQRFATNAVDAYKSIYGYEWQGDNLLMARINLLLTIVEYIEAYWGNAYLDCCKYQIEYIADIISWNIWQMDGLTYNVPMTDIPCLIIDWTTGVRVKFRDIAGVSGDLETKGSSGSAKSKGKKKGK